MPLPCADGGGAGRNGRSHPCRTRLPRRFHAGGSGAPVTRGCGGRTRECCPLGTHCRCVCVPVPARTSLFPSPKRRSAPPRPPLFWWTPRCGGATSRKSRAPYPPTPLPMQVPTAASGPDGEPVSAGDLSEADIHPYPPAAFVAASCKVCIGASHSDGGEAWVPRHRIPSCARCCSANTTRRPSSSSRPSCTVSRRRPPQPSRSTTSTPQSGRLAWRRTRCARAHATRRPPLVPHVLSVARSPRSLRLPPCRTCCAWGRE